MQPSEAIALDIWSFVPKVLASRGEMAGGFVLSDRMIALPTLRQKSASSGGIFELSIFPPLNDGDFATGTLLVRLWKLDLELIIPLVGTPIWKNEFGWRGICPQTLRSFGVLELDPFTQLFLSREAMGKSPPKDVDRSEDIRHLLKTFDQILGPPFLQSDPCRPAGLTIAEHKSLLVKRKLLEFQLAMAQSGFPIPVFRDDGLLDVFATVRNRTKLSRIPKNHIKALKAKISADHNARFGRVRGETYAAFLESHGYVSLRHLPTPAEQAKLKAFNVAVAKMEERQVVKSLGQMFMTWEPVVSQDSDTSAKNDILKGLTMTRSVIA